LLGAAAVTVPGAFAHEAKASDLVNRNAFKSLPVSCLSYSFNGLVREGMMDIFHYFETCRYRFGLDAADLWNGMFKSTEDDFVNKVHRALEERQLVVPNIAVDEGHLLASGNEDAAKLRATQDRYLQIAKKLGAGFVRFDAGPYMNDGRKEEDGWTNQEFDFLVKRYKELAQFAYDNGFVIGAENHWGPEKCWVHMEKLIKAVDHKGFGICVHFGGWTASSPETREADNDAADKAAANYICHTHFPWDICESPKLPEKMNLLREAGYKGYYSAEHHSGQNEYNLTEVQIAKIRAVLTAWNNGGTGELIPPRRPR
jgi:sugar phosphate isomerase/epimerase